MQPRARRTTLAGPHPTRALEVGLHPPPPILLTGFGPFPGMPHNPTAALVANLMGRSVAGHLVHGLTLDVSYERAPEALLEAARSLQPVVILMTGVAGGATRLRIESGATNLWDPSRPDADGRCGEPWPDLPTGGRVAAGAPLERIAEALGAIDLATVVSVDAGSYVCNGTYLRVLSDLARWPEPPVALFLHVPNPGTTGPHGRVWRPADLEAAVRCVLTTLVAP